MTPEDHLDQLIEQQLRGRSSPTPASDEEATLLAAAEAFARLNELAAPPDMTARLRAGFRTQLRTGHQSRITHLERQPVVLLGRRRVRVRHPWLAALSLAAVLLLACLGVRSAASSSLPGDLLYGVKQLEQRVALASAGSTADRARLQISQLQGAIADLETEVNARRADGVIAQALSIVATETHDSQSAVASLPAGTEREAVERTLTETLHSERTTLFRLLARVDWPMRLAGTQQLGVLGAPVPTVTRVTVVEGAAATLTLHLTGTNFVPGALLVINGTPRDTVSQLTPTALVAEVTTSDWPGGTTAVGILNPDGTAAQVLLHGQDDEQDGSGGGDDHDDQGTPGPCNTPGLGNGQGGQNGDGDGGGGSCGGD